MKNQLLLLAGGLLVASCQEGPSSNPKPKPPPLTIKITYPPGSRLIDSAAFEQMLREPGVPDSLPLAKPAATPKP